MSRIKKVPDNKHLNILDGVVKDGLPIRYLYKVLYIVFLYTAFIFLNHHADRNVAEIKKLKYEVDNLKAEYRTIHSDFRNNRLQSTIAKIVKPYGIIENDIPPLKIKVKKLHSKKNGK